MSDVADERDRLRVSLRTTLEHHGVALAAVDQLQTKLELAKAALSDAGCQAVIECGDLGRPKDGCCVCAALAELGVELNEGRM